MLLEIATQLFLVVFVLASGLASQFGQNWHKIWVGYGSDWVLSTALVTALETVV